MNAASVQEQAFDTDELRRVLEKVLSEYFAAPRRVEALEHHPSIYSSSFALEELKVKLEDGSVMELLLKDASAPFDVAQQAKPAFVRDPQREIEVYRSLLKDTSFGTPRCYGVIVEPERGHSWLLLEKVAGLELYQVGDLEVWKKVARWLAGFHDTFAQIEKNPLPNPHLLNYDAAFYRAWMQRALQFAQGGALRSLAVIAPRFERVIERLLRLPYTVLHGEFYASNILVEPTMRGLRVCPVDWEMAALGPGMIDVAALAAGNWSEEHKTQMAQAYYQSSRLYQTMTPDAFLQAFNMCRLHLAMQWLGWARDWSPPPEHAHDWLNEARMLAERLGIPE